MRDFKFSILQCLLFTGMMIGLATPSFAETTITTIPASDGSTITGNARFTVQLLAEIDSSSCTPCETKMRWDINGDFDSNQVFGINANYTFNLPGGYTIQPLVFDVTGNPSTSDWKLIETLEKIEVTVINNGKSPIAQLAVNPPKGEKPGFGRDEEDLLTVTLSANGSLPSVEGDEIKILGYRFYSDKEGLLIPNQDTENNELLFINGEPFEKWAISPTQEVGLYMTGEHQITVEVLEGKIVDGNLLENIKTAISAYENVYVGNTTSPVAVLNINQHGEFFAPLTVELDGSSSYDNGTLADKDINSEITRYEWGITHEARTKPSVVGPSTSKGIVTLPDVGKYTIKLTVWDTDGREDVTSKVINVKGTQNPIAVPIITPISGPVPLPVSLDGESQSSDPDGDSIIKHTWSMNIDGETVSLPSLPPFTPINYVFNKAGRFDIRLEVESEDGRIGSAVATVEVNPENNRLPTSVLQKPSGSSAPTLGRAPFTLILDGNASTDPDEGDCLQYWWTLDDELPSTYDACQEEVPEEVSFDDIPEGEHRIQLEVKDKDKITGKEKEGIPVSEQIIVYVLPELTAPKIIPITPLEGPPSLEIVLSSESYADVTYQWFLVKDGMSDEWLSNELTVRKTFDEVGDYKIKLVITDRHNSNNSQESTKIITVEPPNLIKPTAIPQPKTATTGVEPFEVAFSGKNSSDEDGVIYTHTWQVCREISCGEILFEVKGEEVTISEPFKEEGEYFVRLIVMDNDGLSSQPSEAIYVKVVSPDRKPPVINQAKVSNVQGLAPLDVALEGSASDIDGDIIDYKWTVIKSDGSLELGPFYKQNHSFSLGAGTYTIQLTVTDNDGLTAYSTPVDVRVGLQPPPEEAPTAAAKCKPIQGDIPLDVECDGDYSHDPDGKVVDFKWFICKDKSCQNGGTEVLKKLEQPLKMTFDDPGSYFIELVVTDNNNLKSEPSQYVTIFVTEPLFAWTPPSTWNFPPDWTPGEGWTPPEHGWEPPDDWEPDASWNLPDDWKWEPWTPSPIWNFPPDWTPEEDWTPPEQGWEPPENWEPLENWNLPDDWAWAPWTTPPSNWNFPSDWTPGEDWTPPNKGWVPSENWVPSVEWNLPSNWNWDPWTPPPSWGFPANWTPGPGWTAPARTWVPYEDWVPDASWNLPPDYVVPEGIGSDNSDNVLQAVITGTEPEQGSAPLEVKLDASDSKGDIKRYRWKILSSGRFVEGKKSNIVLEEPGTYTITLEVYDENGSSDFTSAIIIVEEGNGDASQTETPPVTAKIKLKVDGTEIEKPRIVAPKQIELEASGSLLKYSSIAPQYEWKIVSGDENSEFCPKDETVNKTTDEDESDKSEDKKVTTTASSSKVVAISSSASVSSSTVSESTTAVAISSSTFSAVELSSPSESTTSTEDESITILDTANTVKYLDFEEWQPDTICTYTVTLAISGEINGELVLKKDNLELIVSGSELPDKPTAIAKIAKIDGEEAADEYQDVDEYQIDAPAQIALDATDSISPTGSPIKKYEWTIKPSDDNDDETCEEMPSSSLGKTSELTFMELPLNTTCIYNITLTVSGEGAIDEDSLALTVSGLPIPEAGTVDVTFHFEGKDYQSGEVVEFRPGDMFDLSLETKWNITDGNCQTVAGLWVGIVPPQSVSDMIGEAYPDFLSFLLKPVIFLTNDNSAPIWYLQSEDRKIEFFDSSFMDKKALSNPFNGTIDILSFQLEKGLPEGEYSFYAAVLFDDDNDDGIPCLNFEADPPDPLIIVGPITVDIYAE